MFAKTLIYKTENGIAAAVVRGDRDLNETKLKNLLGVNDLEMADAETILKVTGAATGFAGPVGLEVRTVADLEVRHMKCFITGANETDYHYKDVYPADCAIDEYADIRNIVEGDRCPVCKKPVSMDRGIEVGHIFKLGTKYSKAMGCTFLDENGSEKPMIMGSYGIGVARTMAAVIEQNHDVNGIIWPASVAPYQVVIIPVNTSNGTQMEVAEELYAQLEKAGLDVLLDDRKERAGVKFNDADLIGIPARITVGRRAGEGFVEYKLRRGRGSMDTATGDVLRKIKTDLKI
jgi:prolyl-tRNA synthetase